MTAEQGVGGNGPLLMTHLEYTHRYNCILFLNRCILTTVNILINNEKRILNLIQSFADFIIIIFFFNDSIRQYKK